MLGATVLLMCAAVTTTNASEKLVVPVYKLPGTPEKLVVPVYKLPGTPEKLVSRSINCPGSHDPKKRKTYYILVERVLCVCVKRLRARRQPT